MSLVNDITIACVRIASTITAQGLLRSRNDDGTITIMIGDREVTGQPI